MFRNLLSFYLRFYLRFLSRHFFNFFRELLFHWLLLLWAMLFKLFLIQDNTFNHAWLLFFLCHWLVFTLIDRFASDWSWWFFCFKDTLLNEFSVKASSARWYITSRPFVLFLISFLSINKISNICFDHPWLRIFLFFFLSWNTLTSRVLVLFVEPLKQFKNWGHFSLGQFDNLKNVKKTFTLIATQSSIWLIALSKRRKFFSF